MIDLGLAEPGEYYPLGMVLYGFKEARAWCSDRRDSKLLTVLFLGRRLEQGLRNLRLVNLEDHEIKGKELVCCLITYVDDFLVLSGGFAQMVDHRSRLGNRWTE